MPPAPRNTYIPWDDDEDDDDGDDDDDAGNDVDGSNG